MQPTEKSRRDNKIFVGWSKLLANLRNLWPMCVSRRRSLLLIFDKPRQMGTLVEQQDEMIKDVEATAREVEDNTQKGYGSSFSLPYHVLSGHQACTHGQGCGPRYVFHSTQMKRCLDERKQQRGPIEKGDGYASSYSCLWRQCLRLCLVSYLGASRRRLCMFVYSYIFMRTGCGFDT